MTNLTEKIAHVIERVTSQCLRAEYAQYAPGMNAGYMTDEQIVESMLERGRTAYRIIEAANKK